MADHGAVTPSSTQAHDAALHHLLVDSVRDCAIFALDPQGFILTWNAGAERCKGYTADEAIGQHFSIFYPAERKAARFPHFMLEVAARDGRFEDEGWRVRKDGSRFWANVLITPLRNEEGEIIAFAKVTRDLTVLRAAHEREIENARRLAAEETARRLAEEANSAKGEFLAAMSHELRTPLNAIAGYAELMATGCSGPVTPLQLQQLERIQHSQQHLLGIINNILNYSRVEAGQLSYHLTTVCVEDAAEASAQLITPQSEAKGIQIVVHRAEGDHFVRADRAKLQQVLINLLSNALKFSNAGGTVEIAARDVDERVAIEVRDTGIGIPADKLHAIFEPFVQLQRSLTNVVEGTGLGLAISRDLARAMDGDLHAESAMGVGSTFTLVLPRAEADA